MSTKLEVRDVVVVIPGILGSVLNKDGDDIWALSFGAFARGIWSRGKSLDALELVDDDPCRPDAGDGVTATRLISDFRIIPGLKGMDGYDRLHQALLGLPGIAWGKNYFHLPYDWRRDNRVAARRLKESSKKWLEDWRDSSGNADAQLILVCHSMGGLVARYFLEHLQGWRSTRMVITYGTPFRGAPKAIGFLNEARKGVGPLSVDLTDVVRSLTSVYQLLPTYGCCSLGDGERVALSSVDVPGIDPLRRDAALEFHGQIEAAAETNAKDPAYAERGYLLPIVGRRQPTLQSAEIGDGGVTMVESLDGVDRDGDGTVPCDSAIPLDAQGEKIAPTYGAQRHAAMQNAESLHAHLVGLLLEPKGVIRAPEAELRLEFEEVHPAGRPIPVVARLPLAGPDLVPRLRARAFDPEGERAATTLGRREDGAFEGALDPLEPGSYRLAVEGEGVEDIGDVFAVVAAEGLR